MSGLLGGIGSVIGGISDTVGQARAVATTFAAPFLEASALLPAWIRQGRRIGMIIPDVTIEESHTDRVQITQHPVSTGSPVADHAFRLPAQLTMKCGWSNANTMGTITSSVLSGTNPFGGFTETRAKEVYESLHALMGTAKRPVEVISITTGKRNYTDMILTELSTKTDHTTEYSLIIEAQFTQIIRVKTRSTTQPSASSLIDPQRTEATTDSTGKSVDVKPSPNSILLNTFPGKEWHPFGFLKGVF
jgi:hypothetical protein